MHNETDGDPEPERLFVTSEPHEWLHSLPGDRILSELEYLCGPGAELPPGAQVLNLSATTAYQSLGYYVSLLAVAREHTPLPTAATLLDLPSDAVRSLANEELQPLLRTGLLGAAADAGRFVLRVYFGRSAAPEHAALARALFLRWPLPLLCAELAFDELHDRWLLTAVRPLPPSEVPVEERVLVASAAVLQPPVWPLPAARSSGAPYRLAILADPAEDEPPSDEQALQRFLRAAPSVGLRAELITEADAHSLAGFDALFIRETTALWNHTYRLARKAAELGLVVVDDPDSILRCCNKVFLAELLRHHGIAAPATGIVHRGNTEEILARLGLPCILKRPDVWASRGVLRVDTAAEFRAAAAALLRDSAMIVAQEYLPTEFDWRIGLFGGAPIYASRYYMVPGHWQIVRRDKNGERLCEGPDEALPLEQVPPAVLHLSLRAARLIGDGFYGIDLKETARGPVIIEINDNPSVDSGIEDALLGDELYLRILRGFRSRITERNRRAATLAKAAARAGLDPA
jgi:glutathione synthase/RimK-type ligase-like ATP-grasp enzyme